MTRPKMFCELVLLALVLACLGLALLIGMGVR